MSVYVACPKIVGPPKNRLTNNYKCHFSEISNSTTCCDNDIHRNRADRVKKAYAGPRFRTFFFAVANTYNYVSRSSNKEQAFLELAQLWLHRHINITDMNLWWIVVDGELSKLNLSSRLILQMLILEPWLNLQMINYVRPGEVYSPTRFIYGEYLNGPENTTCQLTKYYTLTIPANYNVTARNFPKNNIIT